MSKQEKYLIGILTITLLLVTGIYFYNFFSFHFSKSTSDWGSFGDYFGGVLNPLLTCILIYLVIKEGIDSRKNYLESKQVSLKSHEQINKQIRILKPKPEVVYYLKHENSRVYAILENIGNAVAYDIHPVYKFNEEPSSSLGERIFRLQAIQYIAPNQKAGVFIGHMNINDVVIGIPEHM